MADVFHMNIEEDSIAAALRAHAEHIVHVHLADSHRREPGSGHLDFAAVFEASPRTTMPARSRWSSYRQRTRA
jgi:sugar phosphate isomerase/epimerase